MPNSPDSDVIEVAPPPPFKCPSCQAESPWEPNRTSDLSSAALAWSGLKEEEASKPLTLSPKERRELQNTLNSETLGNQMRDEYFRLRTQHTLARHRRSLLGDGKLACYILGTSDSGGFEDLLKEFERPKELTLQLFSNALHSAEWVSNKGSELWEAVLQAEFAVRKLQFEATGLLQTLRPRQTNSGGDIKTGTGTETQTGKVWPDLCCAGCGVWGCSTDHSIHDLLTLAAFASQMRTLHSFVKPLTRKSVSKFLDHPDLKFPNCHPATDMTGPATEASIRPMPSAFTPPMPPVPQVEGFSAPFAEPPPVLTDTEQDPESVSRSPTALLDLSSSDWLFTEDDQKIFDQLVNFEDPAGEQDTNR